MDINTTKQRIAALKQETAELERKLAEKSKKELLNPKIKQLIAEFKTLEKTAKKFKQKQKFDLTLEFTLGHQNNDDSIIDNIDINVDKFSFKTKGTSKHEKMLAQFLNRVTEDAFDYTDYFYDFVETFTDVKELVDKQKDLTKQLNALPYELKNDVYNIVSGDD